MWGEGGKKETFNINKCSRATETSHLEAINGDLGKPLAICSGSGERASESRRAMCRRGVRNAAALRSCVRSGLPAAPFLPYAGCPFSALDDLSPCLRVRKTHLCALVFLEGKGNIFKLRKSRDVAGIFWVCKACVPAC